MWGEFTAGVSAWSLKWLHIFPSICYKMCLEGQAGYKKTPPLKRYGEVEGDGSGDGRWAGRWAMGWAMCGAMDDMLQKCNCNFLNYALVSFFHRYKIISFVLNSRLLLIFFYQLSLYCIPHVVLSPNAHRPSSIVGSKSLRYDYLKGDGRWWSKVYGMRGGGSFCILRTRVNTIILSKIVL